MGYIFRVTKPSVTSERKTAESIFSDMEGMVLYSSLKRKTPLRVQLQQDGQSPLVTQPFQYGSCRTIFVIQFFSAFFRLRMA